MKKIDFHIPDLWENESDILAVFTKKNADVLSENRQIKGLNLGLNTNEDASVILENRKLLYQELDLNDENVALVHQVHGNQVIFITEPQNDIDADALVTNVPGLAIGIKVADCAAVLLADRVHRVVGAAHAGWRGAVSGVVKNTIQKMIQKGAETDQIEAYVSPCICQKKFEVGEEVAVQFDDKFVDRKHFSKPHVDLKGYLKDQLMQLNVKQSNIEVDSGCTISDEKKFYSYRREKNKSGRMLALICLR
ncbi:MAG TPA: peptidoglycan editing factor PgeF [Balneolales bacterium]|nr:peptidoglycan editing factor PgeF [Balneolales bacterium]